MAEPAIHHLTLGGKKTRCGKPAKGRDTTNRYEDVTCGTCTKLIDRDCTETLKSPKNGIKARRMASIDLERDIEGNMEEVLAAIASSSPQQIYGYLITWKDHRKKERENFQVRTATLQDEIEQLKRALKVVCETCPKKPLPASIPEHQRQRILYSTFAEIRAAQSEEEAEQALINAFLEIENLYKQQGGVP